MNHNIISLLTRTSQIPAHIGAQLARSAIVKKCEREKSLDRSSGYVLQHRRLYAADAFPVNGDERDQSAGRQHWHGAHLSRSQSRVHEDHSHNADVVRPAPELDQAVDTSFSSEVPESDTESVTNDSSTSSDAAFRHEEESIVASFRSQATRVRAKALGRLSRLTHDRRSPLLDIDYVAKFPSALARREPDLAVRCIFAARQARDWTFISSISTADYSAVLDLLKPSNFIGDLLDIHYGMKNATVNNFGLTHISDVAKEYDQVIREVMRVRRRSRTLLSLSDYELVLAAAKTLQLHSLADYTWSMLNTCISRIIPNTRCWNGYIGTHLHLVPVSATTRHQYQVLQKSVRKRSSDAIDTNQYSFRIGEDALPSKIDRLFATMRSAGNEPDTESYCILITAHALVGDITSVDAILKNVWNIDLTLLRSGDNGAPLSLDVEHPLYPSEQLLFDVLKAYCINDDLMTALALLDHICKHYQVTPSRRHWNVLLEWAHVLSRPREPWKQHQVRSTCQTHVIVMRNLWQIMTSDPYNLHPTLDMYDIYIRRLRYQEDDCEEDEMIRVMEKGRRAFTKEVGTRAMTLLEVERIAKLSDHESTDPDTSLENAGRAYELAHLRCTRDLVYVRSWLHYYLYRMETCSLHDLDARKTSVHVPGLLWRWQKFVPRVVSYHTTTGHVELLFRTKEESESHKLFQTEATELRNILLESARRFSDRSWMTNRHAADRAHAEGFPHNRTSPDDDRHKRLRGLRRPPPDW